MDSSVNQASAIVPDPWEHAGEGSAPPTFAWFAEVYEDLLPQIYRYLLARTGSQEDAADLAQQAFTQALGALPRYRRQDVPISAWIFRIARNLLADHHRRQRPTVTWEQVPEAAWPAEADDTEASAIRRESLRELATVLDHLDPPKRDLLAMRFAGGLKVREIAAVLNRKEATVRSELRRILLDLQERHTHD